MTISAIVSGIIGFVILAGGLTYCLSKIKKEEKDEK